MKATVWLGLASLVTGAAASLLTVGVLLAWRRVGASSRKPLRRRHGLPWWWSLAWPGLLVMPRWRVLQPAPRVRRELQERLRRADLSRELSPEDVRALQWSFLLLAAFALAVLYGLYRDAARDGQATLWWLGMVTAGLGWLWPLRWVRLRAVQRQRAAARALPFTLDMLTLSLEGGLHFQAAVQQVVDKGPTGPLRDELQEWLGEIRAGATRAEALRALAQRLDEPAIRSWVQVMLQADGLGMSLGPILRAQAEQRRAERFLLAEKRALQAPVKMLFPLIACIFPCTFLVLGFPIAMYWLELGL